MRRYFKVVETISFEGWFEGFSGGSLAFPPEAEHWVGFECLRFRIEKASWGGLSSLAALSPELYSSHRIILQVTKMLLKALPTKSSIQISSYRTILSNHTVHLTPPKPRKLRIFPSPTSVSPSASPIPRTTVLLPLLSHACVHTHTYIHHVAQFIAQCSDHSHTNTLTSYK